MSLFGFELIEEKITKGFEHMVVTICRGVSDYRSAVISIDYLEDSVMWDDISGGVKRRQAGYSLYAFIPYHLAARLNIGCSGMHDFGYNDAKIMIPKAKNRDERFRAGYQALLDLAGEKPVVHYRLPGLPPCTQFIEKLLHERPYSRAELRKKLFAEGYCVQTVRFALNRLQTQNRIRCEGSSLSQKQLIFEGPESFCLKSMQFDN